jgi:histone H3/H4
MNRKTDVIEVDKATADALKARAADRGISVAELLSELARQSGPVTTEPPDIAELDRRWAEIEAGEKTIQNADVVRWLETWGSPGFKPWPQ